MGEVRVPADALWRAQTQRAVENFPISGRGLERAQIRALGLVKGAAARVNEDLGVLDADLADAIAAAADEVAAGAHDDQFPIDVFQTGSGTSSNMNANEVIATLAARASGAQGAPERPRQRLAVVQRRLPDDDPPRRHRGARPRRRARARPPRRGARPHARRTGPTSSRRAAPTSWTPCRSRSARRPAAGRRRSQLRRRTRLRDTLPRLGRAADRRHRRRHRHQRARRASAPRSSSSCAQPPGSTSCPRPRDHIEAQGARDGLVEASGALRTVAVSLYKIANDIRWLSLGPAHRPRRAAPARPAAGQLDHAGQGQPGDLRGDDDGRRPGHGQRRHRRLLRHARATSSST